MSPHLTNPIHTLSGEIRMLTLNLKTVPSALVLGCALLLGVGTTGCGHASEHHHELAEYPVTRPVRKNTTLDRKYVAQVRSVQHIEMRALERGYLQDVLVDEGQAVTKGQLMFRVMPMIYAAEAQKADAEVEFADIEYRTTKALQDKNVVSPNEVALTKAKLNKAAAEQSLARAHLGLTEIRAPFDGIMGRLEVRKGSLLDEGEMLTSLSDNSEMWVYFNVTESEYPTYRRRMIDEGHFPARLAMASGEVFDQVGNVDTIEADFNNETGNIAFRATFQNPDGLLRHGMTGDVLLSTALDDALLIPQKATFDVLDKKFVYVIDDKKVTHLRQITVMEGLQHLYVVKSGLEESDIILLEGLRKVRDGQEVAYDFEEPEEVIAKEDSLVAE